MGNYQGNPSCYFAAETDDRIGAALVDKLKRITSDNQRAPEMEQAAAYSRVYGVDVGYGSPSGVTRGGERGELAMLSENTSTGVAQAKAALVSAAQISWRPQAANGTSGAAMATAKAADVMENEWKTKGLAVKGDLWTEWTVYFAESFMFPEWDKSAGPAHAALGDRLIAKGDVRYHLLPGWDVKRDPNAPSFEACQWLYLPVYKNKFDLARSARRLLDGREGKEAEETILGACGASWELGGVTDRRFIGDTDLVPLWFFFHDPSPILPMGQVTTFLSDQIVLSRTPIRGPHSKYEGRPVVRLAERPVVGSPYARATYWDTEGPQEICNGVATAAATIVTSLSSPVLAAEQGSDFDTTAFSGGPKVYKSPRGSKPPQWLQVPKLEATHLELKKGLESGIAARMGLNDVAMGQAPTGQPNAQAYAVLKSSAVEQSAPLQTARTTALGALGTVVLKILAKNVKGSRSFSKPDGTSVTFTGEDLKNIESVRIEIGNPMEQTTAGRMTILDAMQERGWITAPENIHEVLTTGRLDAANMRETQEKNLAKRHKEMLEQGEAPPVHWSHNHPLFFREGSGALLSDAALNDETVMEAVEKYLDEHYSLQFGTSRRGQPDPLTGQPIPGSADPMALMRERWMLGQAIGPGQEMMAPPMPPGAPAGPPGAPAGAPPEIAPPPGVGPPPGQPELPENPVTGVQLDSVTGGGAVTPAN